MGVLEKLETLLTREFPLPDKVKLEDDDGIIGSVVSARFTGLQPRERINILWDYLDQHLAREEKRRVVMIIALTPEDAIAYST